MGAVRRWRLRLALLLFGFAAAAAAAADYPLPREIAPGVHLLLGSRNEASFDNRGRVGNAAFLVGPSGTVAIETGTSFAHGRQLIALAEKTGERPVELAILTQPLPEFVLGGSAFAAAGIALLAHEEAARLIALRCTECLHRLRRLLGDEEMAGSSLPVAGLQVGASGRIEAGGRSLQLIAFEHGSAPGDLAVLDLASGVLFAGALVSNRRLPDLRDADVQGWLAALDLLAGLPHQLLVPGYGDAERAVDGSGAIVATRAYLQAAIAYVRGRLAAGDSLHQLLRSANAAPEFAAWADWPGYAGFHRRNLQKLYLEEEARAFAASATEVGH